MSEWRKTTLGSESDVLTGHPFRSETYRTASSGIRLLRGDNIAQGTIDWSDAKRLPEMLASEFSKFLLEKGDIVLAMDRPWIGAGLKQAALTDDDVPSLLLQRTARLRGGSPSETTFLRYVVSSPAYVAYIRRITTGSLVPHISKKQIEGFSFQIPSIGEQAKIAKVLSTLDAKIDLNRRLNAELEALAKLLYDYWFVQFDFPISAAQAAAMGRPDLEGKPYRASGGKMAYNAELKREIPEGWVCKELIDIANITMGQSPPGHTYNESGEGELFFQGSTDFGWRFPAPRQYTTAPTRIANEGDILLSVRAPVGTLNIAPRRCAIGRGLAALNSKRGHGPFLFRVMENLRSVFDRRNTDGTTFGSINRDDLRSLKLSYPPTDDLVKEFDERVKPMEQMIFTNHLQEVELTQLRDWLLPMLMNGQVMVGDHSTGDRVISRTFGPA